LSAAPSPRQPWLATPVLLGIFAVLICLRMPEVILKGRFWAEEGNVFFIDAWYNTPLNALFFGFGGYMNIAANAATLASRWLMPLELAPYMTTGVALLVQLSVPLVLLTARDAWLQSVPARLAAITLVLVVPDSEEVWLNSLHCQFHLGLCCAIIVALQPATGRVAWMRYAILFFAPLCGPTAIAVLPLFAVRALLERSRARFIQMAVLAASTAIQLLLFFHRDPLRAYGFSPVLFACTVTLRHIVEPFMTKHYADIWAAAVRARLAAGFVPHKAALMPLLFMPYGVLVYLYRRRSPAIWLFAGFVLVGLATYFGARGHLDMLLMTKVDGRYMYVPQALLSLSVLALAACLPGWRAVLAWGVVAWLIVVGAVEYTMPWDFIADGASWRTEVAAWRVDPNHVLLIWPEGWSAVLKPKG
jgi:hypothetical protein